MHLIFKLLVFDLDYSPQYHCIHGGPVMLLHCDVCPPGGDGWDSLEGVAQQKADLPTVVALLAVALVALGPVELRLDLSDAGHLLLFLRVEVRAGKLVSHGLGPVHQ